MTPPCQGGDRSPILLGRTYLFAFCGLWHHSIILTMKKLTLSSTDKKLAGVLGGIAEYANIDSTVVRLIYVVFTLCTLFLGVLFYIIAILIIPSPKHTAHKAHHEHTKESEIEK